MKLIVVRHAIAEDRDPEAWPNDGERPLTDRGRKRFARAACGIGRLLPEVDIVLSSPHVRAWDTAMLLAKHAGWPGPEVCEELKEAPPVDVRRVIDAHRDLNCVAVVGHEPYLSRLISHLLSPYGDVAIELKKGGAASLELAGNEARLLWLLQPRALRLIA